MKSLMQLARLAYEAHVQSAINQKAENPRLFFNEPPAWAALNAEVQFCWVAAVRAVYEEVKNIH